MFYWIDGIRGVVLVHHKYIHCYAECIRENEIIEQREWVAAKYATEGEQKGKKDKPRERA